jgi:hypothetical protein
VENNNNSLSEQTEKKISSEIEVLQEKKAETMLANNQTASYVKDRVFKYRKVWWTKFKEMIESEDPQAQRTAFIEYNKLQARVLPTQLEGTQGNQIMVNIIGMGVNSNNNNCVEGEVIE